MQRILGLAWKSNEGRQSDKDREVYVHDVYASSSAEFYGDLVM